VLSVTEFLARAYEAVKLQPGLTHDGPVTPPGDMDVIGAYGYAYDRVCQDRMDCLMIVLPGEPAQADLYAASCESANEAVLRDCPSTKIIRALIDLNRAKPLETPKARRTRIMRGIKNGTVLKALGASEESK
jgi:hypothetical protein